MELTWNGEPSGEPSGEPRGEAEAPGGQPPRGVTGGDSRAEGEGEHEAEARPKWALWDWEDPYIVHAQDHQM
jgi:hypothetical protein